MPRVGLTPAAVTTAAVRIVDEEGRSGLTLARVADVLGVRPPSLYNHVDGLEALERAVALAGVAQLADVCRSAVMGRAGLDALHALADAYRSFARSRPGLYSLTQVARPDDDDFGTEAARALEPVFAVLRGFGLADDELVHAARALRAGLHGFAALETQSGFGLDVDVDVSFQRMVAALGAGLASD
jgi:AcrR family transcriptional regulator